MAGESGCSGGLGTSASALTPSAVVPGCCVGGGTGDVCAAAAALAPPAVVAAMEAGTGGEIAVLEIFARAGAALETFGGGVAGELSW